MSYSKTVKMCGVGYADVCSKMEKINVFPDVRIEISEGLEEVYVTVTTEDGDDAKKRIKPVIKEIKNEFGNSIYSTEDDATLEKAVVDLLVANDLTISTVESCTGGLLSGRIINVPGVSEVFKSGVVSYSNKAKRKIIGVKKSTIAKYGAVSRQTAEEMACGMHSISKADVVVSTTGIAGPDGGTDKKPVGLVYIGCYVCGEVSVKEFRFDGDRAAVRAKAVAQSLILMRECVLSYISKKMFE